MSTFSIDDSDLLDVVEERRRGIPIYKILLVLFICIVLFYLCSIVVCVTNKECVQQVPDVHNLLNSTITTPYIVTGINSLVGLHIIVVFALYLKTESFMQLLVALAMYASIGLIFFIFPFSSYNNYGNIALTLTTLAWMIVVLFVLQREIKTQTYMFYSALILFFMYTALMITHIALKFAFYIGGGHIAMLIIEIMSALSMGGFLFVVIYFIGKKTKLYIY